MRRRSTWLRTVATTASTAVLLAGALAGCSGETASAPSAAAAATSTAAAYAPASAADLEDVEMLADRCETYIGDAISQEGSGNQLIPGELTAEEYAREYFGAGAPVLNSLVQQSLPTQRKLLHAVTRYPGVVPQDVLDAYLRSHMPGQHEVCRAWAREDLSYRPRQPVAPDPAVVAPAPVLPAAPSGPEPTEELLDPREGVECQYAGLIAAPGTTCAFAAAVSLAWEKNGVIDADVTLRVLDPDTHKRVKVTCKHEDWDKTSRTATCTTRAGQRLSF